MLKIVGSIEQDLAVSSPSLQQDPHGVWLCRFDESTGIVEYCVPLAAQCPTSCLEQSRSCILDQLCGEALAPLGCLILLYMDSFGGIEPAARLVARWMRFLPLTDVLPRPCLLSRGTSSVTRNNLRHLTIGLLCFLRDRHPERPYSRDEVAAM